MAQMVKNLPAVQETCVRTLGQEDLLEKGKTIHSSILAWRFHGQRCLEGYGLWGCKKSDMTEKLTPFLSFILLKIAFPLRLFHSI